MPCTLFPISEISRFSNLWDAINTRYHQKHPLLESRFLLKSVEHFGEGHEMLAIFGSTSDPDAIGIVTKGRIGTWRTFQAEQSPLGAMIKKPHFELSELAADLFAAAPLSCQIFSITQQDPDLVDRPAQQALLRTLDYIDTARITVDCSFDEYWGSRGKNLRHNMKRQRNRLEREGVDLKLEVLTSPVDMSAGVESYGALESTGWKAEKGTAIHLENEQGRFYSDLLESYARTGNASIYRFYYDGKLSAVDLCIHNESAFVILKTTYDEVIKGSSPALLMRREYFPFLFDSKSSGRIEFYGRVMDWHTKWSDEIRSLYHINAYRSEWIAKLHGRE